MQNCLLPTTAPEYSMGVIRKDATDPAHTEPDDTGGVEADRGFESLVVLQFPDDVKPCTVEWLLGKIEASRFDGGAELLARTVLNEKGQVRMMVITFSSVCLIGPIGFHSFCLVDYQEIFPPPLSLKLNIFYSCIKNTEKDWVLLKV